MESPLFVRFNIQKTLGEKLHFQELLFFGKCFLVCNGLFQNLFESDFI
jgi:hypothetical protein